MLGKTAPKRGNSTHQERDDETSEISVLQRVRDWSIRAKSLFLLGVFCLSCSVLTIAFLMSQTETRSLEKNSRSLNYVRFNYFKLQSFENNFLLRNKMGYVQNFRKTIPIIQKTLHDSLKLDSQHDYLALEMKTALNQYNDIFERVVDARIQIGIDEESGLRGSLREAIHNVEALGNEINSTPILKNMLMLRRREKDFIIRRDLKYKQKYIKDFEKHINTIESAAFLTKVQKDSLISLSRIYRDDFFKLIDLEIMLGLTLEEGILGKLADARYHLQLKNKSFYHAMNQHIEHSKTQARNQFIVLFIVLVSAFLLILFVLIFDF